MNVGELKIPIKIQRFTTKVDEQGFNSEDWVTIATPRAKIEFDDRLMREVFRDDMVNSTTVKIFTFREVRGLNTKDSIVYDGQRFEIYGFDLRNKYHKVWAKAIL